MVTALRVGILKANNQPIAARGLVTTVLAPAVALCHSLPTNRTAIIRKVMWYNPNLVNVTLIFGTVDNAVAPAFIPLLPTIVAIAGLDGWYEETHLPDVEFVNDRTAGALGMVGNIYVQATAINVLVRLAVEEFGV